MSAQAAADLRAAADVLERDGWAQGGLSPDGYCAVEACHRTAPTVARGLAATSQLRVHIGRRVSAWNDTPGRTADEVVATLRAAADRAEAGL